MRKVPQTIRWLGALALALPWTGCSHKAREAWPTAGDARRTNAVAVTVGRATTRPIERTIEIVGNLAGYEEVTLSSKIEGRVCRIVRDVGDRVAPGAELLQIDPTDCQLAVKQAERALDVEMARLNLAGQSLESFDWAKVPMVVNAKAKLENARSRAQRTADLLRSRAASIEENTDRQDFLLMAQAEYDNQVTIAKSGWQLLRARQVELELARQRLRDASIVAPKPTWPTTGLAIDRLYAVTKRNAAEGSYVRVGDEVFRLAVDQRLKLRLPAPERFANAIAVGQTVRLEAAAESKPVEGVIARTNPAVDPLTRTFEVEATIDNSAGRLRPGGFARARIVLKRQDAALAVPLEAVTTFAGVPKVFVVEGGKTRAALVATAEQGRDWIEVSGDLQSGDVVVTSGQSALADGVPVEIRDVQTAANLKDAK